MRNCPASWRIKVYLQALRAGANFVAKEVKEAAPAESTYNSGAKHVSYKKNRAMFITIKNEIKTRVLTKTAISYEIAVHTGRAYWALFYEMGTKARSTEKGAGRGVMPSHPFMRPTWDRIKTQTLGVVGSNLGPALEKVATKLAGPLKKSGLVKR